MLLDLPIVHHTAFRQMYRKKNKIKKRLRQFFRGNDCKIKYYIIAGFNKNG